MGSAKNSTAVNILGVIGLVLLVGMAVRTAFYSIPDGWEKWTNPPSADAKEEPTPVVAVLTESNGEQPEGQDGE